MNELIKIFKEKFSNSPIATERGYIDDVILPNEIRFRLICCLEILKTKVDSNPKKKHGNISSWYY